MDTIFVEKMHSTLKEMRQRILQNLASESEQLREAIRESNSGDIVDLASHGIDASLLESSGTRELTQLKTIEAALGRVSKGSYGHCVRCSQAIQQERLEAMPYAPFCISCQNQSERRKRGV